MDSSININSASNAIEYVKCDGRVELLLPKSQYSEAETIHKMVTDYGCSVCYRVYAPPIRTRKCEHRLCHLCYVQMRRGIVPENLSRPMTLCPECRSPLESIVRPSPSHLPKLTEVLYLDHSDQHEIDGLYSKCLVTGIGEPLQAFSDTVTRPLQYQDILYAPFRATNTVLNLGLFAGYISTCVGLSVGAGVASGAVELGRQIGNMGIRQEPSPPIHRVARSGANWMFNKLAGVYDTIPYESTQLALPLLTYFGLWYMDRKFLQGPGHSADSRGAEDRTELYRSISEKIYDICTPYQSVTDSTIALFRYTQECFSE